MLADSFQVGQEPTTDGPAGLGEDRDCIPVDPAVDNVRKFVDRSVGQIPREPREDGEREPVASRCGSALPWVETVGLRPTMVRLFSLLDGRNQRAPARGGLNASQSTMGCSGAFDRELPPDDSKVIVP